MPPSPSIPPALDLALSPDAGGGDVTGSRDREGETGGRHPHSEDFAEASFVHQFNSALAQAKLDALALLHRLVGEGLRSAESIEPSLKAVPPAGVGRESLLAEPLSPPAPTGEMSSSARTERVQPSVPFLRERRLSATQILRTQFLRIDDNGEIKNDPRRSRSTPVLNNSHPQPVQNPSAIPASEFTRRGGRETIPVPTGSRQSFDTGCADFPARRDGTPDLPEPKSDSFDLSASPAPPREMIPIPIRSRGYPDMGLDDATHGTQTEEFSSPPQDPSLTTKDPSVCSVSLCETESLPVRRLRGADLKRALKQARAKARAPT